MGTGRLRTHAASVLVTPERIRADTRVRLQTGSAGLLLVLLALHRERPEPNPLGKTPLELASDCARHLAESRISYGGLPRAWQLSPGKPPLGGFCYGAAGICYALLRLYEVSRQPEVWEVAQEGLAFLRRLHAPEQGNFLDSWCHGGCGIVLGRLAAIHLMDSSEVRAEIAGALETVRSHVRPEKFARGDDDLCCGHMGRVEVLLQASLVLGDETLRNSALMLASQVWQRARKRGGYSVSAARGTGTFAPTLFQGIAGLGYGYLRLARPEALPSVLLLD